MGNKITKHSLLAVGLLSLILVVGFSFSFQSNDSLSQTEILTPAYGAAHLPGEQRVESYEGPPPPPPPTSAQIDAALLSPSVQLICQVISTPVDGQSYVVETVGSQSFPSDGNSYVILSTGNAAVLVPSTASTFVSVSNANPDGVTFPADVQDGFGDVANDVATLVVQCTIPSDATTLSFDWTFGSEEEPYG